MAMTLAEGLKRLVEQARTDTAFFHELVFDPEKVIGSLTYLDRRAKGALLQINPDVLIRNMIPPDVIECGDTCGGSSCGHTCGSESCVTTCASSCGGTCNSSCDDTTHLPIKEISVDPAAGVRRRSARAATRVTARRRAGGQSRR